jgi:O-antigen/teichoic acid export membrane protein
VDFYIVGFFLDRAALGRYTVAVLIVEAMQKVSSWLATVLSSKVAGGHDREGVITRRFAFIAMLSVVVLASLLGFLDLVSYDYVTHWLGADYQGANLIVLALVPKAIAYAVMVVLAGHLAGRGYTYYHPLAGVCALAVLVAIDLPLIERIGIWAAVAAATLAMATAAIVMYRGVQIATRSPSLSIG